MHELNLVIFSIKPGKYSYLFLIYNSYYLLNTLNYLGLM